VLVVDDDERILAGYHRGFARERCRVLSAMTSAEARELAMRERPELVVVDMRLGHESGIDLVRELKAERPEAVVGLVSGYLSVATTFAAARAGADYVCFKPITCRELLRRVEQRAGAVEPDPEPAPTLARAEWEHMMRVLDDGGGNVSRAARRLGLHRQSLQRRLRKDPPRA
jgi:two-component system response regulator RegA